MASAPMKHLSTENWARPSLVRGPTLASASCWKEPPNSTTSRAGHRRTKLHRNTELVMTVTPRLEASSRASREQVDPVSTMTVSPSLTISAARWAMRSFCS